MNFLIQLVIALVLVVVSVVLTPKPKQPKTEIRELEDPTADAGREIPVVFGTISVKDSNVLWFGEKTTKSYTVDA